MNLTDATLHGTTTVIAALGTDSSSRTHSNLIAKAKELKELGLNVFCHSGSYHLPAKTLTGSITSDLMYMMSLLAWEKLLYRIIMAANPLCNSWQACR